MLTSNICQDDTNAFRRPLPYDNFLTLQVQTPRRDVGRSKTPPVPPPLFVYKNVGPHQLLVGDIFVRSSQRQIFCFLFLPVSCSLLLETHLSSIYKMFSHRFDVMLQLCDKNTVASSIPRQEYCSIINSATRILWHRFFRFHVPCCWNAPIYHL